MHYILHLMNATLNNKFSSIDYEIIIQRTRQSAKIPAIIQFTVSYILIRYFSCATKIGKILKKKKEKKKFI